MDFQQIKDYLATGIVPPSPEPFEKWSDSAALPARRRRWKVEEGGTLTPRQTDGLLKGLAGAKHLREAFSVSSIAKSKRLRSDIWQRVRCCLAQSLSN
jgi:hypothetical protein